MRTVSYPRMKPNLLTIVVITALAGCGGCGRSSTSPTPAAPTTPAPPTTPPVATPQVTRIEIAGKVLLTVIGETSSLTATATLSDGTTRDVTTAVRWSSSDPSSVTISPAGIVTVVRFGSSYVNASYVQKYATVIVQATPNGTFAVFGRVREPGSSGLGGVIVREEASGTSFQSGSEGEFSLGGLTTARLSFEKDGYERLAIEGKASVFIDAAMQRVIRIAAGGGVDVRLAPHDMSYAPATGAVCYPCRLIRITSGEAGRLQLNVAWAETHVSLNLWINGRLFEGTGFGPSEIVADVPVAAGEQLVYIGMKTPTDYYAPLTLSTGFVRVQ